MARTCDYCGTVCHSNCREAKNAANRRSYANNIEKRRARNKKNYEENKSYYLSYARQRQHNIVVRSFDHEKESVNKFYEYAAILNRDLPGVEYRVDHIVPFTHPDVCGLHVIANLQLLKAADNAAKGNKFNV